MGEAEVVRDVLDAIWDSVGYRARTRNAVCARCGHVKADHCRCGGHCLGDGGDCCCTGGVYTAHGVA